MVDLERRKFLKLSLKLIATPHLTNWPNFDYYKDGTDWLRLKI